MPTPTIPGGHGLPPAPTIDSSTNCLIPFTPSAGTHIFRKLMFSLPGALRHALDVEPVPVGDELPVHDRQPVADVRPGVLARDRVHRVRAQRVLDRRARGAVSQRRRRCAPGGAGSARRRGSGRRRCRCPGRRGSSRRRRSARCAGSSRARAGPGPTSRARAPRERVAQVLRDVLQRPDVEVRGRVLDRVLEVGRSVVVLMPALSPRRPCRRGGRRRSTRAASCPSSGCGRACRRRSRRTRTALRRVVSPCSSITRPPFW